LQSKYSRYVKIINIQAEYGITKINANGINKRKSANIKSIARIR